MTDLGVLVDIEFGREIEPEDYGITRNECPYFLEPHSPVFQTPDGQKGYLSAASKWDDNFGERGGYRFYTLAHKLPSR